MGRRAEVLDAAAAKLRGDGIKVVTAQGDDDDDDDDDYYYYYY